MTREELLNSREYWLSKIQIDLFNLIENYRKEKGYNKTELAEELGCTKSYITQILNGDFDHKVSKLVDLALSFGKVPSLDFIPLDVYLTADKYNKPSSSGQETVLYDFDPDSVVLNKVA